MRCILTTLNNTPKELTFEYTGYLIKKNETAEQTIGEVLKFLAKDLDLSLHPRGINIAHRIG